MFQATTAPKAATSGQKGRPNGQPPKFTRGELSGWNVYGSSHGARPCSSWCPTSQRW